MARANDVVGQRVELARSVHEQHVRPYGLALSRTVAVVAPFEPPVATTPAPASPVGGADAEPLIGTPLLLALLGVACLLFLLAGLPDRMVASVGTVGYLLERRRGLLLIGAAQILFVVALVVLIGGSN